MNEELILTRWLRRVGAALDQEWYDFQSEASTGAYSTPRRLMLEELQYKIWVELKASEHRRWEADRDRAWPNGLPAHP